MKWTEQEIVILREMYNKNIKPSEIAKKLNRTKKAIINKAYLLKITNNKSYTKKEKEYILANYKSYNLQEIADHLGREKTNICRFVKENGLERTSKKKEATKGYVDGSGVWHKHGWKRKTKEEIACTRSKIMKEWHNTHEHPKGMKGKTHSEEYRKQISERVKKYFDEITPLEIEIRRIKQIETKIKNDTLNPNKNRKNPYSRSKGGKREDLNNIYFRSSWEANIARYFTVCGVEWDFEPKTFIFDKIQRGCVSYTPDFYLTDIDTWVEVKGWMDDKSKTKLNRFKKYYPDENSKLWLIDSKVYKQIEKKYKNKIPNWE